MHPALASWAMPGHDRISRICQAFSLDLAFRNKFAKSINFTFGSGARVQDITTCTHFAIIRFFHIEAGIEASRLTVFFQPHPDPFTITGDKIEKSIREHLHTQYVVHRQAFANFFLLIGLWRGFPRKVGHWSQAILSPVRHADDHPFFDSNLCIGDRPSRHIVDGHA